MQQRTVITDANDIRKIARDINIFSCRKQIFKVQLQQYSDVTNQGLEKSVVRYYSLGQHSFWNILPGYTLVMYLVLLFTGVIPYGVWGIIPTILLYAPFAFGFVFLLRIIVSWYAKRSLLKLANELEEQNNTYSFVLDTREIRRESLQ